MTKRGVSTLGTTAIGAGVLVVGLLLMTATAIMNRHAPSLLSVTRSDEATSKPWPMNARGQTYGVQINYQEPELVRVAATNNRTGYCLATDLDGPTPRSPEEALQWQAEQGGKSRYVPVFESDGVTQIGVFRLSGAAPSE